MGRVRKGESRLEIALKIKDAKTGFVEIERMDFDTLIKFAAFFFWEAIERKHEEDK